MYSKKLCFITYCSLQKTSFTIYFTDNQKHRQGQTRLLFFKILECECAGLVKNDVGIQRNPLTQEDDWRHAVALFVDLRDVDVAIDKCLDIRVPAVIVPGKIYQSGRRML